MRTAAQSIWTPDLAEEEARAAGIAELSEKHWRVIAVCRELAAHDGLFPPVEQVASDTGLTLAQIAALFGGRPAELIPAIAGIERSKR
jgi:sulfur relay (sulfurtransferase) DsrC/TusE family protein